MVLAVLAVVLGLLSRRMWSILGGGALDEVRTEAGANDTARDDARRLVAQGYAGLITAATFKSELTNLGHRVLRQRRGHRPRWWPSTAAGSACRRSSCTASGSAGSSSSPAPSCTSGCCWPTTSCASPSRLERMVTRGRAAAGRSTRRWSPPTPWATRGRRRPTCARPTAAPAGSAGGRAAAILVTGIIDVLDSITPPLRGRLHVLEQYLPLRASVAAGALVAMAGLALIALGRGILRGQRRAWRVSVVLLAGTILLHVVAGADIEESLIAGAVLVFLLVNRREFQAASDATSLRSALVTLAAVALGVAVLTTVSIELFTHIGRHGQTLPWWTTFWAVSERFAGITTIDLPERADRFLAPALLTIGLCLVAVTLYLLTRPVVDRRLGLGPGRRVPGPGHRPPPRRHHPRLLRPAVRQAVVLPPRQPGGLRRLRRGVPDLARPHRPPQRARAGVGGVPGLRRRPRLDHRGHGGGRGVAPHLPRLGHAQHLPGRRGRGAAAGVQPGRQAHEGPAPGPQPDQEVRLHRHASTTRRSIDPALAEELDRAHAAVPPGRARARASR